MRKTQKIEPDPNFLFIYLFIFYDRRKFRRQCVNVIDTCENFGREFRTQCARTVSPCLSVQCELAFKQLGSYWDSLSNSLDLYHVAFRNWRVCLSSPLQALSRVTPSGLQSAVPRWDPPHTSRADQPRPWSALGLLQQPLTMWNQPQQIKSKQETSFLPSSQCN